MSCFQLSPFEFPKLLDKNHYTILEVSPLDFAVPKLCTLIIHSAIHLFIHSFVQRFNKYYLLHTLVRHCFKALQQSTVNTVEGSLPSGSLLNVRETDNKNRYLQLLLIQCLCILPIYNTQLLLLTTERIWEIIQRELAHSPCPQSFF